MMRARELAEAGAVLHSANRASLIGDAVLALIAIAGASTLVDSVGSAGRRAPATVLAKEHRSLGHGYVVASVEPSLYVRLHEAQPVSVRLRRGRLAGTVEVLAVDY
jgi:hypothetical protein